jgi:RimJ/RimL family protein N-acetyltransferase
MLQSEHLQLKTLTYKDVTQKYVDWMNDPTVNQYTESRFAKHTIESVIQYVKDISGSSNDFMFGIYKDNSHIGNIKLNVNRQHDLGDIGLIIGDKNEWGKGYATESIRAITDYGFKTHGLNKIMAGIYSNNIGSIKAFIRAGYEQEAKLSNQYKYNSEYIGSVMMSIWK